MGAEEVQAFLNHLSTNRRVAASTQNRALCALVFLYRDVLKQKFGDLKAVKWVKRPQRLPVVFKREEIGAIFSFLKGVKWITLLYGTGLRVMECVRLRVKDIDFAYNQIIVRDGKGHKERVTILPDNLKAPLKAHLENVRRLHQKDISEGFGRVYFTLSPGTQISKRQFTMALAICISSIQTIHRSTIGCGTLASLV